MDGKEIKKLFFFKEKDFLKHSGILFIATFIGGACNYAYQLYMGRGLGPEGYGIFGSLFAISYILFVLAGTIQTSTARFISGFVGEEKRQNIRMFLIGMYKRVLVLGILIFLFFLLASSWISSFLKINSIEPILIVGSFFLFSLLLPVNMGVLQGLQRFEHLGICIVLNFLSKFVFGFFLVNIGFGVNGALSALTLSAIFALIPSFIFLRTSLSEGTSRKELKFNFSEVYKYSLPALLTMFCFAVPANVDMIIVKHFFSSQQAGLYTAASVLGKIVLFIPEAIALVMFPKVTEALARKENSMNVLYCSILYTGLLSGIIGIAYWIFPSYAVEIPFGYDYINAVPLVKLYGIAMFFFSLSFIIMRYSLALRDQKYVIVFSIFTFLEIALLSIFHEKMTNMVSILVLVNAVWFLSSVFYVKWRAPKLNNF